MTSNQQEATMSDWRAITEDDAAIHGSHLLGHEGEMYDFSAPVPALSKFRSEHSAPMTEAEIDRRVARDNEIIRQQAAERFPPDSCGTTRQNLGC